MQMYCSNMDGWLRQADAMESYMQGPRTGKCYKLKVQNLYCCAVYWNKLYTRRVIYSQSFLIFLSSNINSRQNGVRMYPSHDVMFISALMDSFVLYVKKSIVHVPLFQLTVVTGEPY